MRRRKLAPLDPDEFAAWSWRRGPRKKGTAPVTVDDLWFALVAKESGLTKAQVRRWFLRLAAKVRRNERLGLDPWVGIV